MLRFFGRLIGYTLLAPFVVVFALFFGLPFMLAILVAESWDDKEFIDLRVLGFTMIFAIIQNSIILYIVSQVMK